MAGCTPEEYVWDIWDFWTDTAVPQLQQLPGDEEEQEPQTEDTTEVAVSTEAVTTEYYRRQLEKSDKRIYKAILKGLQEHSDTIRVSGTDADRIERAYRFVMFDHPELFWCTGSMQYTMYSGFDTHTIIEPEYSYSQDERASLQKKINKAVKECLSGISMSASDYEKAKYIFEYLVKSIDYEEGAEDGQNICSALINRQSVCAGYARSAQLLLQKLGIPCIYVTGTIDDGGSHAWNIIQCDGKYYHFDATFGDRTFSENSNSERFDALTCDYSYLCCTDEEIYRAREADTLVKYPSCIAIEDNYFVREGQYYSSFDKKAIRKAMKDSINSGERYYTCKFANRKLYRAYRDTVINDLAYAAAKRHALKTGSTSINYSYCENEDMCEISIAW